MAARWDLLLVAFAAFHAAAVLVFPAAPLIAIGVWWNSNTVAHNFIHRPFFRARSHNLLFSASQSVLLGIPQVLWRERHLAHHADVKWQLRISRQVVVESALVCGLWTVLFATTPMFFINVYAPGYIAGLLLCAAQGYFEHARATTSHYGWIYNTLCFNDGYHVEHHKYPGVHWTALPARVVADAHRSPWPPLLRWIDELRPRHALDGLERLVLLWPPLQHYVVRVHERAFRAVLADLPRLRRIAIVGGGLFPRTAMVLQKLRPEAQLLIIDADRAHLEMARALIGDGATFRHALFTSTDRTLDVDLIVIPLAFSGDRAAIYREPPAPAVVIHDWIWRRRGRGQMISLALCKRLNLVQSC